MQTRLADALKNHQDNADVQWHCTIPLRFIEESEDSEYVALVTDSIPVIQEMLKNTSDEHAMRTYHVQLSSFRSHLAVGKKSVPSQLAGVRAASIAAI